MIQELQTEGWNPRTRDRLEKLIEVNAHADQIAVFDFDNTVVAGDIGEAFLEELVSDGVAFSNPATRTVSPPLKTGMDEVTPENLLDYYELMKSPPWKAKGDSRPHMAYLWASHLMAGMTVADVVRFTEWAWHTVEDRNYPRPQMISEMIDLIGVLNNHGIRSHIVSSSNVWSLRWVIDEHVNPEIEQRFGAEATILPEEVIGTANVLYDRTVGALQTDRELLTINRYRNQDIGIVGDLLLMPMIAPPIPIFAGKVAAIYEILGRRDILLAVGDSLNDINMLEVAKNALWIARLDDPELQSNIAKHRASQGEYWMVQPRLGQGGSSFISTETMLERRFMGAALEEYRDAMVPWLQYL